MNHGHKSRYRNPVGQEKDLNFLSLIRVESEEQLNKLKRHYKKTLWRVVAIDRELARRNKQ